MLTGPLGLKARHLGRKLGLNSLFARLLASDHYEHRFSAAIARCVREGDNVWDVGANIGSYALLFTFGWYDRYVVRQIQPESQPHASSVSKRSLLWLLAHSIGDGRVRRSGQRKIVAL